MVQTDGNNTVTNEEILVAPGEKRTTRRLTIEEFDALTSPEREKRNREEVRAFFWERAKKKFGITTDLQ